MQETDCQLEMDIQSEDEDNTDTEGIQTPFQLEISNTSQAESAFSTQLCYAEAGSCLLNEDEDDIGSEEKLHVPNSPELAQAEDTQKLTGEQLERLARLQRLEMIQTLARNTLATGENMGTTSPSESAIFATSVVGCSDVSLVLSEDDLDSRGRPHSQAPHELTQAGDNLSLTGVQCEIRPGTLTSDALPTGGNMDITAPAEISAQANFAAEVGLIVSDEAAQHSISHEEGQPVPTLLVIQEEQDDRITDIDMHQGEDNPPYSIQTDVDIHPQQNMGSPVDIDL